jgi:hypothetical protein
VNAADDTLDTLARVLGPDARILGGCEDCDAYQSIRKAGATYVLTIFHDDTCPTYLRQNGAPS